MKIQIIDSYDQLCFRAEVSDRFSQRLAFVLANAVRLSQVPSVVPEVELDVPQTISVLEALEADLRELTRDLTPPSTAGTLFRTTVLGREMTLDLRLDAHCAVKQLNDLVCALRVDPDRIPLSVLVVPHLSSRQFYLLTVLKSRPGGIERRTLVETLQEHYESLMRLPMATDELRAEFRHQAASLNDSGSLAADIEDLQKWGLLEIGEERLLQTRKLLRLRL